jgi:GlpG protein
VTSEADRIRRAEADDQAKYQRRVRTRQSLFPQIGGFGVGPLTCSLILVCVAVAIYSRLGQNQDFLQQLFISYPASGQTGLLPEVFDGQVWRLITPVFIHFGVLHLLFNMLWLFQLGCMVEGRQGTGTLALVVLVFGIVSNLAQYFIHGPFFGGMSGVVYALAGYIWMRGKHDHASGLYLDWRSIEWLLIWLVLCFTGLLGPVANAAHLGGLIAGVVWGRVSAWFALRRPE